MKKIEKDANTFCKLNSSEETTTGSSLFNCFSLTNNSQRLFDVNFDDKMSVSYFLQFK